MKLLPFKEHQHLPGRVIGSKSHRDIMIINGDSGVLVAKKILPGYQLNLTSNGTLRLSSG